uniref:Uncharacterized protein n=1 Tax=uncultured marine microorganism HF4000_ANIW137I15 TaxID=455531 RepID=B3T4K8_9ZZZZ|nr:hypothetical protein ALOHA_HF4000ANIW137I15ctg3g7 [uncultured marine microorganism HF4000_ANIW137I15]
MGLRGARDENHRHVPPFLNRLLLHLGYVFEFIDHSRHEAQPQMPVRHLPAPEHDGDFDLVSIAQKPPDVAPLELKIVFLRFRAHFDFLDVNDLLPLLGIVRALALLIFKAAIIHDPANGRFTVRGHFHQIEIPVLRSGQGVLNGQDTELLTIAVHHADLPHTDVPVDALRRLGCAPVKIPSCYNPVSLLIGGGLRRRPGRHLRLDPIEKRVEAHGP